MHGYNTVEWTRFFSCSHCLRRRNMRLNITILFGLACVSLVASRQYNARTQDVRRRPDSWTRSRHLDSPLNQRQSGSILRRLSERVRESRLGMNRAMPRTERRRPPFQTNSQNGRMNFGNRGPRVNSLGRFENRNANNLGIRDNRLQGRTGRNNRDPLRITNRSRMNINDNSINRLRNNFMNRSPSRNGRMMDPSRNMDMRQMRRRMMMRNNRM